MTLLVNDGAAALAQERATLRPFRAAMQKALLRVPGPAPFANRLAMVEQIVADPATSEEARIAWRSVTQFERLHPDVLTWAPAIGIGEPVALDGLFRLAMAIEARNADAADALLTRLKGLLNVD